MYMTGPTMKLVSIWCRIGSLENTIGRLMKSGATCIAETQRSRPPSTEEFELANSLPVGAQAVTVFDDVDEDVVNAGAMSDPRGLC